MSGDFASRMRDRVPCLRCPGDGITGPDDVTPGVTCPACDGEGTIRRSIRDAVLRARAEDEGDGAFARHVARATGVDVFGSGRMAD